MGNINISLSPLYISVFLKTMAGIYIHIPFCKQQCSYCDFHFSTTFEAYRNEMIESICAELKKRSSYLENKTVNTIYFGGGTPSLLTAEELTHILDESRKHYSVNSEVEITLEANPDDITDLRLEQWADAGINRLSIGLQSFKQSDLDWMNRAHTVEEALSCVQKSQKKGFTNLTVDLIYGLPDLTMKEWESHVQRVIDMQVPHISAYCLTVEGKTALNNWVEKGKITVASENEQSDQFLRLLEMMEENGYEQYEISNFSIPRFESKHNSNYWKGEWYVGIGPSAHSFNGTSRNWNLANNRGYMKTIASNENTFETELLSEADQFNEAILTGLRTRYGVPISKLSSAFSTKGDFVANYEGFIAEDWMYKKENTLFLTKEGKLRADYIASELFVEDN